ncbi:hypothetical protein [Emticicia sp. 17c]|uniref:hypothetical protein n=1 Tax=Emticicia sp. 17c TaxID=3127704 RepID=UPI00301DD3AB
MSKNILTLWKPQIISCKKMVSDYDSGDFKKSNNHNLFFGWLKKLVDLKLSEVYFTDRFLG